MVKWYAANEIIDYYNKTGLDIPDSPLQHRKQTWINCGGQIIEQNDLTELLSRIKSDAQICTWDTVHEQFDKLNKTYGYDKYIHALGCLAALEGVSENLFTIDHLKTALQKVIPVCKKIAELTLQSRLKDYTDHYRTLVYDSNEEMNAVLGEFENDTVITTISEESQNLINSIHSFVGNDI
jgi:hypothetical protein